MSLLVQLLVFELQNNSLTVSVPMSWENMGSLGYMDMSRNNITGSLPSWYSVRASSYLLYSMHACVMLRQPYASASESGPAMMMSQSEICCNALYSASPPSLNSLQKLCDLLSCQDDSFHLLTLAPAILLNLTVLNTMCDLQLVYLDMSNNALDGGLPSSWGYEVPQEAGMLLEYSMQVGHLQ